MQLKTDIQPFQEALNLWFEQEKESYPWRQTKDPWAILVSEVMLQQTQVATVLNKQFFTRFLQTFPDVQSISTASETEILRAWEGLGYYRRVRNLQKTAQAIVAQHGGVFPENHAEILALPGIGPYTAGAVSSFAFGQAQPLVDANVARVFARLFDYSTMIDTTEGTKQLWQWASILLDKKQPAHYNSALMELGQKVCKLKKPQCMLCPVQRFCSATIPEDLPKKKPKRRTVKVEEHCIYVLRDEKILLRQEGQNARRQGMWTLPQRPEMAESTDSQPFYQGKYAITHHQVSLFIYEAKNTTPAKDEHWHNVADLPNIPLPSPFRKALNHIISKQ